MENTRHDRSPGAIRELLVQFVRRRRYVSVLRAIGIATALAAMWLLVWGLVDRLLPLNWMIRIALLFMLALLVGWIIGRKSGALFRRHVDWTDAARQIERRDRRFGEALATVVSHQRAVTPAHASPQLLHQLAQQVQAELTGSSLDGRALVSLRPAVTA